jgi:hypothetical protein
MERKCCPACCGIGSYLGREWVRDESGLSIYTAAALRKSCEVCNGSGRVMEAGPPHAHFCSARTVRRPATTRFLRWFS